MRGLFFGQQLVFCLIDRNFFAGGSFPDLLFNQRRQNPAWADRIAGYIGLGCLKCGDLGQPDDPVFCGDIGSLFN